MNRIEPMNSQESDGMVFPYDAYDAFVRKALQSGGAAPRVHRGAPMRVPMVQGSSGTKRRRAQVVRRDLLACFDAAEAVDDVLKTSVAVPKPCGGGLGGVGGVGGDKVGGDGPVEWNDGEIGHENRRMECHQRVSKGMEVSADVSSASAFTVENHLQQSTSLVSDSRGGRRRQGGDGTNHVQFVSLLELLMETERGSQLTLPEAKALVYGLAEDLSDIHAGRDVHTDMCLGSTALNIVDGTGRASLLKQGARGALAQPVADVRAGKVEVAVRRHTMPPEMVRCRPDMMHRLMTDKGNVWSLGCIMFSLLAGGVDLFGAQGLGVCGKEILLLSVDRQQSWLSCFISDKMRRVNESKANESKANESKVTESKVNGIANHTGLNSCGVGPMSGESNDERIFAVGCGVVGFDDLASDLLSRLLRVDPAQRLSAKEVLSHPWFDAVRQCLPQGRTPASHGGCHVEDDPGNTGRSLGSENDRSVSDDQEQSERSDLKYSRLHQKYIFIDPSVLSPMHPYTLIGHVKKEIEFESLGEAYGGIGVFAVYNVPHHGTMMSAKPIKVIPH